MNSDHKLLSFDMNETFSQRSRRPCLHTYTTVHKKRLLHWNQPVIATITSQFELLKIMNISTHHNDRMLTTVYNSKAPHINSASFSYRLSKMSLLHVKDKLAEGPKTTWFLSKWTWKCISDSPPLCVSTTAPQNYDVCEYEMSHVLMLEFRPRITISRFLLSIG